MKRRKRLQIWLPEEASEALREVADVLEIGVSDAALLLMFWDAADLDRRLKGWILPSESERLRKWLRSSTSYRNLLGSRHCR